MGVDKPIVLLTVEQLEESNMNSQKGRNAQSPGNVPIRRNLESYGDPYLRDAGLEEATICRECHSVNANHRWYRDPAVYEESLKKGNVHYVLCPACQKIRDKMPGGILTLAGAFLAKHKQDILNLLQNEDQRAQSTNPMERIMDIRDDSGNLVVETTNEKLAQRLGRAMFKAHGGAVDYKWSAGTKLARVNWQREE